MLKKKKNRSLLLSLILFGVWQSCSGLIPLPAQTVTDSCYCITDTQVQGFEIARIELRKCHGRTDAHDIDAIWLDVERARVGKRREAAKGVAERAVVSAEALRGRVADDLVRAATERQEGCDALHHALIGLRLEVAGVGRIAVDGASPARSSIAGRRPVAD